MYSRVLTPSPDHIIPASVTATPSEYYIDIRTFELPDASKKAIIQEEEGISEGRVNRQEEQKSEEEEEEMMEEVERRAQRVKEVRGGSVSYYTNPDTERVS
ncbi:hypothetical protein BDR06DRAFT_1024615 [Suillus hirtellus]|nr:hypothetical protein BDR06DRAFT_1024615 [Suillus hirtellus]